ncbi:DNA internalization-related competence protein ComEC/Rec2 [Pseudoxanthomonas japonensis]|uniref:DNA internalization-related competence protein ComEC/Rec2 n=1 Tax=Pseudoxanthomonas japonensis TaxID=69284 RepID=A0ABQ6ZII3_9GAMM|nr:DNA internalization-related competence protein ComEC/Rec2 [Pseudoxanthomonas japonensis]KAF1725773.1 DNA internalization-related competence protein ComEC/Rec2 [Pseudoxanthomonas japonensis]
MDRANRSAPAPMGLACVAALLAGMVATLWSSALPAQVLLWALLVLGLAAWRVPSRARWIGAGLAGVTWAGLHATWSLGAQLPVAWEGREVTVTGRVVGLPEPQARRTRFLFRVDDEGRQPAPLQGRLLRLAWYDEFGATEPGPRTQLGAGERWRLRVRVRAPRGLANPGGVDTERYAAAQRISAMGYVRDAAVAERLSPAAGIDGWRSRMSARIADQVPDRHARFVQALALGDTRGLDDRDWQVLRATGLTHLIAISGFHVGMVAGACALAAAGLWWLGPALARHVPRPQAAGAAALVSALGYAAVAGFALPTVRTVLMIAVVVLARLARRHIRLVDTLALAMLAVLLFDPLSLLAAGFWLSFGGVAWLAWCLPSSLHWAKAFLPAQGVATVGLLPFTAVLFGQASLAGPLANLLAIPWWSLVVVPLSLVGTGLEALLPGTGSWAWRAASGCFAPSWQLFERVAQHPYALWWLPESPAWALWLALAGGFWLLLPRGVPGKSLALLLWLPLLWPDRERPREGEVELVVIDVGQGLSALVRTANHALLFDAGPAVEEGFDAGERAVVPALRALGVPRLHALVVSHGDNDHAGGVEAVRASLPVRTVLAPPGSPVDTHAACIAGASWHWDGVRFRFLHPGLHFPYLGNEASCVLKVETPHGGLLLPGDIGAVIERGLVHHDADALRADVVVLPHHGSAGSSDPAFVAATSPRLVLNASGAGNRFGHPRADVVARWRRRGAEVLDTQFGGALRVWLGANGLQVRERRHDQARWWDAVRRQQAGGLSYRLEEGRPDAPED